MNILNNEKNDANTSYCRLGYNLITKFTGNEKPKLNDCLLWHWKNVTILCKLRTTADLASSYCVVDGLISKKRDDVDGVNLHGNNNDCIDFLNDIGELIAIEKIPSYKIFTATKLFLSVVYVDGAIESEKSTNLIMTLIRRLTRDKFLKPKFVIKPTGSSFYPIKEIMIKKFESSGSNKDDDNIFLLNNSTLIVICDLQSDVNVANLPLHTTKDTKKHIGGLEKAYRQLREIVDYPFRYPGYFNHLNITCPKGVLLYGPPGVGKTMLVSTVANDCKANLISIEGPAILSPYIGQSEENLREIFRKANDSAEKMPTILFIDEIDSLSPTRETGKTVESRMVAALLTLMDGFSSGKLCVVGATNRPNAIDAALRRPGRFDREINIEAPNSAARLKILENQLNRISLDDNLDLSAIANSCIGYVGADLSALTRSASILAIARNKHNTERAVLSHCDFVEAMKTVTPSIMRENVVKIQKKFWSDIGGLASVKKALEETVLYPLLYKESYKRLGVTIPKGVLLHGPPGCSKTTLVKVLASLGNFSFFSLSGAQIFSAYVGETEKTITQLIKKARASSPAIVFFDEIESIAGKRAGSSGVTDRLLATLLVEMDGIVSSGHVVFIAATNRLDMLDSALTRPGRFEKRIYVPLPDIEGRIKIFEVHSKNIPKSEDVDLNHLAEKCIGFTGADIENVCREAALLSLRENIENTTVSQSHYLKIIKTFRPTLTKTEILQYNLTAATT